MTAAAGVLNARTGAPVTADSVFQIGSITKVWTATLVMQLVDEGLVDLDAPLTGYLPDFRVLDEQITSAVTARHLLDHTSGIGGDFFPDTGRGDDCVARYVAEMSGLGASHPLGATMSYANSGFVVLGRLVEVVTGKSWDTVLRERLFAPLGLEAAGTLPEEALLWGAAAGHFGTEVTPQWGLPRAIGPAGLIHARAVDLLAFARLHLADGVTADGQRVLSAEAARAMREPQAAIPEPWTSGSHVGLGWMLSDWGRPVFGHDGQTLGQTAYLQVVPGPVPVAVALLTNSNDSQPLYRELFSELLAEHAGVTVPSPPAAAGAARGRGPGRHRRDLRTRPDVLRRGRARRRAGARRAAKRRARPLARHRPDRGGTGPVRAGRVSRPAPGPGGLAAGDVLHAPRRDALSARRRSGGPAHGRQLTSPRTARPGKAPGSRRPSRMTKVPPTRR